MSESELVAFVRERGLAVIATQGPGGAPEAALVGIAATDKAELIFDTSIRSRKFANISAAQRVALVIGGTTKSRFSAKATRTFSAARNGRAAFAPTLINILTGSSVPRTRTSLTFVSGPIGCVTATTAQRPSASKKRGSECEPPKAS